MEATLLDGDTMGMLGILHRLDSHDRAKAEREIADRVSAIKAGVGRYPQLDELLSSAFSDNIRVRLDLISEEHGMVIERYSADAGCWLKICDWPIDHLGEAWTPEEVIGLLRKCDTRQFSTPEAYLRHKRDMAARTRAENERRANEKVMAAVESLGRKRIKNFIDVERAIVTGDRITAHGADADSFERMYKASLEHEAKLADALKQGQQAAHRANRFLIGVDDEYKPVLGDEKPNTGKTVAINPGHHPKVHKRDKR